MNVPPHSPATYNQVEGGINSPENNLHSVNLIQGKIRIFRGKLFTFYTINKYNLFIGTYFKLHKQKKTININLRWALAATLNMLLQN